MSQQNGRDVKFYATAVISHLTNTWLIYSLVSQCCEEHVSDNCQSVFKGDDCDTLWGIIVADARMAVDDGQRCGCTALGLLTCGHVAEVT